MSKISIEEFNQSLLVGIVKMADRIEADRLIPVYFKNKEKRSYVLSKIDKVIRTSNGIDHDFVKVKVGIYTFVFSVKENQRDDVKFALTKQIKKVYNKKPQII